MAEQSFKHISVTAPDDEDEVIYAGASRVQEPVPAAPAPVEPTGQAGKAREAGDRAPFAASVAQEAAPMPDQAIGSSPAPERPTRKRADEFRETTLEDLKDEPMSLTQKIVIIAAVVCIIGAIAFYLAFMR